MERIHPSVWVCIDFVRALGGIFERTLYLVCPNKVLRAYGQGEAAHHTVSAEGEGVFITLIPALPPACCLCHVENRAVGTAAAATSFSVCRSVVHSEQLILDRAAPTLVRTLENGQGTGVLKETSTIAVASMAKMFVGDIVEEGKKNRRATYKYILGRKLLLL